MVFKDLETCLGVGEEGRGRGSELSEMIARREKREKCTLRLEKEGESGEVCFSCMRVSILNQYTQLL